MSKYLGNDKKEALKDLLHRLHRGESPARIKEEFKAKFKDVSAEEISRLEEELIKEGMRPEELHRLCDIHLALFRESLEKERESLSLPPGHPVHILMREHEILQKMVLELKDVAGELFSKTEAEALPMTLLQLRKLKEQLQASESHYLREENVLFPYLEKHGITQPPAIMWMEHDQIRELKKSFYDLLDQAEKMPPPDFKAKLKETTFELAEMISNHFYKENNILFPAAVNVLEPGEWPEVRSQFDEMGYCCFTPEEALVPSARVVTRKPEEIPPAQREVEGAFSFETGALSLQEVEAIFSTLPVDITFVDKDDTVRFFSQTKERIFPRTKAVIGRKVQQCHPQKSVHMVNKILEDFKSGTRNEADFWIRLNERLIYIRYFPLRDKEGKYLGCLEVTQDVTDIQRLKGEKRLL
jgi:hypothetical protein